MKFKQSLRAEKIAAAKSDHFDIVIIGGGITGAGIFLKCCQQGLKTLLIDANDFASGTSSRSAKMVHGGLRYLQYMQIRLVKEALKERENLLQLYPHLVKPLPFLMPIYGSRFSILKMSIGLSGYDKLAESSILPKHKMFKKRRIVADYPMLKKDGLVGGLYYYDAITNDARLTNEVIMEGCELGGVALNYVEAEKFESDSKAVKSIRCNDLLNDQQFEITANNYISATGVWTDEILTKLNQNASKMMLPGKGIHIVVDGEKFPDQDVLIIPCTDKRFLWICPWVDGLVIIGSTDTPYEGDLREPGTTQEDVDYILQNINNYLEGFAISESDILSIFSGLRPLIDEQKDKDNSSKVSRDYKVWWEKENLLMIAGGKLTSFLSMADQVMSYIAVKTKFKEVSNEKYDKFNESDHLTKRWGKHAPKVKALLEEDPTRNQKLVESLDYQIADIIYYIRFQNAEKLSDILSRRMALTYRMKKINTKLVDTVADTMQKELNWSEDVKQLRIKDFELHWQTLHTEVV